MRLVTETLTQLVDWSYAPKEWQKMHIINPTKKLKGRRRASAKKVFSFAQMAFDVKRFETTQSLEFRREIARRWILSDRRDTVKQFLSRFEERETVSLELRRPLVPDLVASGSSLIRFGDSEAAAMVGKPTWQMHSIEHRHRQELFDALFGYSSSAPYLLAYSPLGVKSPNDLRILGKWGPYRRMRALEVIARHIRPDNPLVYDAYAFKREVRETFEDPSPLWNDAEAVVLLTNERVAQSIAKSNVFGGRFVHSVLLPEWEAYSQLDRATAQVEAIFKNRGFVPRSVPILVGLGHAGKSAVFRMMHRHRVLDLGAFLGPKHAAGHSKGFRTKTRPASRD